jgi:alpha-L-rhamnosidase
MKKLTVAVTTGLFLISTAFHCNVRQNNHSNPGSGAQSNVQFLEAKPVWIKDREKEKNLSLGFRACFNQSTSAEVTIKIAASTIYGVFLNGQFVGHGPARAAHGFYRIDEWPLTDKMQVGENIIAVEVVGYNVNSYYLLDQAAFLQAEVIAGEQVVCATGNNETGFKASIMTERIQKVPRFSFQRPFMECYRLNPQSYRWRNDCSIPSEKIDVVVVSPKKLLIRGVKYSDFRKRTPVKIHSQGKIISGQTVDKYWKSSSLTKIGKKFGGYKENELTINPSFTLQETKIVDQQMIDQAYSDVSTLRLSQNEFSIIDFGVNLSGFIGAKIICDKKSKLFLVFDEVLSNNDVDFKRLSCINIISYDLDPGSYDIESFEPYTLRYLKMMVLTGDCIIKDIYLREYVNSDISHSDFQCSNDSLNKIYAAGRETFRQNAIDIFMDCPSRERAGWLCDSYFTARVAMDLSGNTLIEKNFYENYLLPEKFEHLPEGMLPMCYPADHPDSVFISNWALWFVVQLEEYSQRSADREMVDALKLKVLQLFQYFERFKNQDGLLENLESWVFVEWSEANKFTQDVNYPTNMLYSGALAAAGRLYNISEFISRAEKIRNTIRKQSFNGKFFIDNAIRNDNGKLEVTNNSSEVCQYYAFVFNVASPVTHKDLWQTLMTEFGPERKTTNKYPHIFMANSFIGNYLRLELLSHYGRTAQLVRESMDNFYYMAERTGTLWENIEAYASCNHGFASHIVHVLYRDILGIYHIDYKKKKIILRFTDINLKSCRGQIPIGDQIVKFKWQRDTKTIHYSIDIPDGYKVEVKNLSGLEISKTASDGR